MRPIHIGLLGLGTVGGGTLAVLQQNAAEIARRAGREIAVSHASSRSLRMAPECHHPLCLNLIIRYESVASDLLSSFIQDSWHTLTAVAVPSHCLARTLLCINKTGQILGFLVR